MDVEVGRGPCAAVTELPIERNDDGGYAKRVDEAGGHDADDTSVPHVARDEHALRGRLAVAILVRNLRSSLLTSTC